MKIDVVSVGTNVMINDPDALFLYEKLQRPQRCSYYNWGNIWVIFSSFFLKVHPKLKIIKF